MLASSHRDMLSTKTKYISSWGIAGGFYPVIIGLVLQFGVDMPSLIYAPLVPLIFVAETLGLAVADAGDSWSPLLPTIVIITFVLLLNAACYAGIGWLSWPAVKKGLAANN